MNTRTPLLSVVVPVNQMSGRLQLLDSWLREKSEDTQVILVHDDHNHDQATHLELESLQISNTNIELIRGNYGNPGLARNRGISCVLGKWVVFCDSDDYLYVRSVEKLIKCYENAQSVLICSYVRRNKDHVKTILAHSFFDVFAELGIWRMVFPLSALEDARFPSSSMGEDMVFFASVAEKKVEFLYLTEIVYEYSIDRPDQLTKKPKLVDIERSRRELSRILMSAGNSLEVELLNLRIDLTLLGMLGVKYLAPFTFANWRRFLDSRIQKYLWLYVWFKFRKWSNNG